MTTMTDRPRYAEQPDTRDACPRRRDLQTVLAEAREKADRLQVAVSTAADRLVGPRPAPPVPNGKPHGPENLLNVADQIDHILAETLKAAEELHALLGCGAGHD